MSKWRTVELSDLVDIHDSRRIPLSKAVRASRSGPYPYYGAQGIIDHLDDYIFDGRFILIPEDGENLRSRKLPIAYFAEGKFWVNNHAHIVSAKPGIAVDRFVQSAIEATDVDPYITGAAQPKLSQKNLRQIQLSVPCLKTQEVIGEILDSLDDLLENNRRRIEVLEEMAQVIYREWFVHFRYPGHEGTAFVDSLLGPIPEGWEVTTVGAVLELKYGKALKKADRAGGNTSVVGSSGVVGTHNEALLQGPSIVVGRKGNVGNVVWISGPSWPIDTTYYVKTDLPLRYVAEQLKRAAFINSHAAVPGLSRDQAYSVDFLRPDKGAMRQFEEITALFGQATEDLVAAAERLASIRDLLLPKLVTGEIDVSELDLDSMLEAAP